MLLTADGQSLYPFMHFKPEGRKDLVKSLVVGHVFDKLFMLSRLAAAFFDAKNAWRTSNNWVGKVRIGRVRCDG